MFQFKKDHMRISSESVIFSNSRIMPLGWTFIRVELA
jgi:hypothetical protein